MNSKNSKNSYSEYSGVLDQQQPYILTGLNSSTALSVNLEEDGKKKKGKVSVVYTYTYEEW
ncbi:hypothetical protein N7509_007583 [Penicillium cosmopolitanum]|uniref:Uncharacterized protein n=1 Tax=Penicillium cosmopolitanum TaxID=1131564 RepID=A0A9X0B8K9_9EURO|nr:uncharacterized protein N7509_007583 [Penicillium cosmopolitanum]KAJ5392093.1 hypothetical protein N7509_007583 [Penicillium cosmopolitanum]